MVMLPSPLREPSYRAFPAVVISRAEPLFSAPLPVRPEMLLAALPSSSIPLPSRSTCTPSSLEVPLSAREALSATWSTPAPETVLLESSEPAPVSESVPFFPMERLPPLPSSVSVPASAFPVMSREERSPELEELSLMEPRSAVPERMSWPSCMSSVPLVSRVPASSREPSPVLVILAVPPLMVPEYFVSGPDVFGSVPSSSLFRMTEAVLSFVLVMLMTPEAAPERLLIVRPSAVSSTPGRLRARLPSTMTARYGSSSELFVTVLSSLPTA